MQRNIQQMIVDEIPIIVEKKKIKNMYIRIIPPDGRVKITAPRRMSDALIRQFAQSRLEWIRMNRTSVVERAEKVQKHYVTGEEHFLWGIGYPLMICQTGGAPRAYLENRQIILETGGQDSLEQRENSLIEWYRRELKEAVPSVMKKCTTIVGRTPSEWRIKNMKTRWGTCNVADKKIWLNLQLAKYPPECLEYVVTHELVHLYEKNHNARFWAYMDQFYPNWKNSKGLLAEQK